MTDGPVDLPEPRQAQFILEAIYNESKWYNFVPTLYVLLCKCKLHLFLTMGLSSVMFTFQINPTDNNWQAAFDKILQRSLQLLLDNQPL
jgi:hypothetical protein